MQSSQQILTDLKIRIHDRDEALVHYDLRRNKLHSWQEKQQKDPNYNKIKFENVKQIQLKNNLKGRKKIRSKQRKI